MKVLFHCILEGVIKLFLKQKDIRIETNKHIRTSRTHRGSMDCIQSIKSEESFHDYSKILSYNSLAEHHEYCIKILENFSEAMTVIQLSLIYYRVITNLPIN